MSDGTCDSCGDGIVFRWVGGRVAPIHSSGGCGGNRPTAWGRSSHTGPHTAPSSCPICGESVFYHTNGFGDSVYFDELGPPWPKHPCLDRGDSRSASRSGGNERVTTQPFARPTSMTLPPGAVRLDPTEWTSGKEILGLVLNAGEVDVRIVLPGWRRKRRVYRTAILLNKSSWILVHLLGSEAPRVGSVVRLQPQTCLINEVPGLLGDTGSADFEAPLPLEDDAVGSQNREEP
jgi:hypothetical protein